MKFTMTKQTLTQINLELERAHVEAADFRRALDFATPYRRCPGGRPIIAGLICPHCSADLSDGEPCHKPRPKELMP